MGGELSGERGRSQSLHHHCSQSRKQISSRSLLFRNQLLDDTMKSAGSILDTGSPPALEALPELSADPAEEVNP